MILSQRQLGLFQIAPTDPQVYPESYWEPLVVVHNATVTVQEGTRAIIPQGALDIMHPNIDPSVITYVIVQRPHHGYLEVDHGHTPTSDYEEEEASLLRPEVWLLFAKSGGPVFQEHHYFPLLLFFFF